MFSKRLFNNIVVLSTALFLSIGCSQGDASSAKQTAKSATASTEGGSIKLDAFEQAAMEAVKSKIEDNLTGLPVDGIQPSPIPDWYEFLSGGDVYYVSHDGNYLFSGQLVEIRNGINNLTAESKRKYDKKQSPIRKQILDDMDDAELVVYQADEEKYQIDVFVDINCGYCRKLHLEIPQLNKQGVTVRYLGYPRAGLGSSSHRQLESAWCADDRPKVMSDAILNRAVAPKSCKNPVAKHYALVKDFGLSGTPAIVFANGDIWPGYLKASDLMKEIKKREL